MNPWSRIPSNESSNPTSHNIHTGLVRALVSPSLAVPPASVVSPSGDITGASESATESGEPFSHRITDPHAAEPVGFHPSRLVLGQQGIGHELILVEDRVVEPQDSMVRRGANP